MLKLCIDPGHGGEHSGGTAPGLIESEYIFPIAIALLDWIDNIGMPVDVMLLRSDGETVSLSERGRRSKEANADLVLSLHVNAAPDKKSSRLMRGAMCFHWTDNVLGERIASAILRTMPPPLHTSRRRSIDAEITRDDPKTHWLARPRCVLGVHAATAVLVEVGFMSHRVDLPALLNPHVQRCIVAALLCGVTDWVKVKSDG